jgi:hypothetical protein
MQGYCSHVRQTTRRDEVEPRLGLWRDVDGESMGCDAVTKVDTDRGDL